MARLDGMTAVVHGGSGQVGEGIVRALLADGAQVIVPSRKPDAIGIKDNRLFVIEGSLASEEQALALKSEILEEFPQVDAVIASLSGIFRTDTPVLKMDASMFRQSLEDNLVSHFICARTWLPVLQGRVGTSYTAMGGLLAENPMPNHGSMNVPFAGLLMMMKVLFKEAKGTGVRLNEVMVNSRVASRDNPAGSHTEWVTSDEIGRYVAWLVSPEAQAISNAVLPMNEHFPLRVR